MNIPDLYNSIDEFSSKHPNLFDFEIIPQGKSVSKIKITFIHGYKCGYGEKDYYLGEIRSVIDKTKIWGCSKTVQKTDDVYIFECIITKYENEHKKQKFDRCVMFIRIFGILIAISIFLWIQQFF